MPERQQQLTIDGRQWQLMVPEIAIPPIQMIEVSCGHFVACDAEGFALSFLRQVEANTPDKPLVVGD